MIGEAKPDGTFDRLRHTARRKGALSFADLSATIVDAQKATGFVDTLSVDAAAVATEQIAEGNGFGIAADGPSRQDASGTYNTPIPEDEKPSAESEPASSLVDTELDRTSGSSPARKGRVRAPVVQCNLKITEQLRDALHLQALRERRAIADLVTEVMTAYLTKHGTFDRLR